MGAQFSIPLVTVIPGQLIASALWNAEFQNINVNFIPSGMDSYSDTDAQMQIQTNPYPGSVTSHATSLGGEIERIRYQISQILGATSPAFWYAAAPTNLTVLANISIPIGGIFEYPTGAVSGNPNFHNCDGTLLSRVAYPVLNALYAGQGYPYGAGDGSTTFALPNKADRISIGVGSIFVTIGQTGGSATHTLTTAEIPSGLTVTDPGHNHTQNAHNHGVTDPGHLHTENGQLASQIDGSPPNVVIQAPSSSSLSPVSTNLTTNSATTGISTNNATATNNSNTTGISVGGGGGSHSIMPPVVATYYLVRIS